MKVTVKSDITLVRFYFTRMEIITFFGGIFGLVFYVKSLMDDESDITLVRFYLTREEIIAFWGYDGYDL